LNTQLPSYSLKFSGCSLALFKKLLSGEDSVLLLRSISLHYYVSALFTLSTPPLLEQAGGALKKVERQDFLVVLFILLFCAFNIQNKIVDGSCVLSFIKILLQWCAVLI